MVQLYSISPWKFPREKYSPLFAIRQDSAREIRNERLTAYSFNSLILLKHTQKKTPKEICICHKTVLFGLSQCENMTWY